jgi:type II secretion system protein N
VEEASPSSRSRPLRIAAVVAAAIVLTTTFVYLGFPYDRLGPILEAQAEAATGARITVGAVSASPQLLGPGIAFEDLRADLGSGPPIALSRLRLRPAWSLSWLRGRPALAVDAESGTGHVQGVVTLGSAPSFEGEASELDLRTLGVESFAEGLSLEGTADVELSLSFEDAGTEGPITLTARSGNLSHPSLPLSIPYDEIRGDFVLGGEVSVRIESLEIDSSLGQGSVSGTVGHGASTAPLDLEVRVTAAPAVQAVLRAQGVRLDRKGAAQFRVAGTASSPAVR